MEALMKAKIYRFIFSALLLCASFASKGQTVDGKLYTIFNNWYQWSGGKFNTNLNIPKVTATTGRDTGAIRYALTDSSMYVWTGSQWRQVGGSTPTLQQVTTAGNTTTDTVTVAGLRLPSQISTLTFRNAGINSLGLYSSLGGFAQLYVSDLWSTNTYSNNFHVRNNTNNFTGVFSGTVTANRAYTIPDTTGTLSVGVAANGTTYMAGTNGITNIGNTDTATVVKAYVTNAEAVTITKGQVVYIFGAQGDRASVKLAKNTSDTFSSKTLGIVRADIAAGQAGWITTQGQVSGINLSAYSPGDILWLDSVAGGFTKNKPQAPKHSVFVGVVERANAGNGLIYVKPQNGQELGELHDTKITSPTNNQVLAYTAATDIWENKTVESILQFDTVPLAVFGAGSGAAGDTAAFSTSAVYGSFYNAGSDTLIITQMRAGVLGTSPSITTEVYWNDSLNITAGATILVSGGTSVTGTIGATNVTSFTNNKIPPNAWVFVRTSAVATKPTYFTLTLLGYKKRI
jgi:hypothetical protein